MAISVRRRRDRVGPGMTGDTGFTRLQRAHGNAAEHIPPVLLGLLLLELTGFSRTAILVLGIAFVLGRFAHAAGIILRPRHPLHTFGGAATYTIEVALGVLLAGISLGLV
jgi:hypothetical protein